MQRSQSAVRFNATVDHISEAHVDEYDSGHEDDAPLPPRRGKRQTQMPNAHSLRPRKPTGYEEDTEDANKGRSATRKPSRDQLTNASESGAATQSQSLTAVPAAATHPTSKKGFGAKLVGAIRGKNTKTHAASAAEEPASEKEEQHASSADLGYMTAPSMTEAFAPVFCDATNLFLPSHTYNTNSDNRFHENLTNLPRTKSSGFAAIVESAVTKKVVEANRSGGGGNSAHKNKLVAMMSRRGGHGREAKHHDADEASEVDALSAAARERLQELAERAKERARAKAERLAAAQQSGEDLPDSQDERPARSEQYRTMKRLSRIGSMAAAVHAANEQERKMQAEVELLQQQRQQERQQDRQQGRDAQQQHFLRPSHDTAPVLTFEPPTPIDVPFVARSGGRQRDADTKTGAAANAPHSMRREDSNGAHADQNAAANAASNEGGEAFKMERSGAGKDDVIWIGRNGEELPNPQRAPIRSRSIANLSAENVLNNGDNQEGMDAEQERDKHRHRHRSHRQHSHSHSRRHQRDDGLSKSQDALACADVEDDGRHHRQHISRSRSRHEGDARRISEEHVRRVSEDHRRRLTEDEPRRVSEDRQTRSSIDRLRRLNDEPPRRRSEDHPRRPSGDEYRRVDEDHHRRPSEDRRRRPSEEEQRRPSGDYQRRTSEDDKQHRRSGDLLRRPSKDQLRRPSEDRPRRTSEDRRHRPSGEHHRHHAHRQHSNHDNDGSARRSHDRARRMSHSHQPVSPSGEVQNMLARKRSNSTRAPELSRKPSVSQASAPQRQPTQERKSDHHDAPANEEEKAHKGTFLRSIISGMPSMHGQGKTHSAAAQDDTVEGSGPSERKRLGHFVDAQDEYRLSMAIDMARSRMEKELFDAKAEKRRMMNDKDEQASSTAAATPLGRTRKTMTLLAGKMNVKSSHSGSGPAAESSANGADDRIGPDDVAAAQHHHFAIGGEQPSPVPSILPERERAHLDEAYEEAVRREIRSKKEQLQATKLIPPGVQMNGPW